MFPKKISCIGAVLRKKNILGVVACYSSSYSPLSSLFYIPLFSVLLYYLFYTYFMCACLFTYYVDLRLYFCLHCPFAVSLYITSLWDK